MQSISPNRLVTYNSQEGEYIEKYLKNSDLAKLIESYLFNDAYMRVKLPDNLSEKTKMYTNMNTVLDHEQFAGFYAFHYEKNEAHSVITNQEIQTRVNEFVQKFLNGITDSNFEVLDHYLDFRFNTCMWSLLYLQTTENSQKIMIKEIDIPKHDSVLKQLFTVEAERINQLRRQARQPPLPHVPVMQRINNFIQSWSVTSDFMIKLTCATTIVLLAAGLHARRAM
jgi:hypothetical protein